MRSSDRTRNFAALALLRPTLAAAGLAVLVSTTPGCRADYEAPSFAASTPQSRAAAVAGAVTSEDRSSIPDLIKALDDDDPVIRSWAIRGLEEMTGQTLGFEPFAPQGPRDAAVERWVQWRQAGGQADMEQQEDQPPHDPHHSPPTSPPSSEPRS